MIKLYIFLPFLLLAHFSNSQCQYDNIYLESKIAPAIVGDSIVSHLSAGEYSRIRNLKAGYVYQISTCGDSSFDSQISIFDTTGTLSLAFNDDYPTCAPQSQIYFSPLNSGSYDILVDEFNCLSNNLSIAVSIKLYDTPLEIITIPTVVHVVYNDSTENISDAQIFSQIKVLNQDFRRQNPDISSAPSRFRGFSKDTRIEFCLASKDPDGNFSSGITRTFTTFGAFGNYEMKYSSLGGKDAWPTDNYLNIWVVNLSGNSFGFAQFPGGPMATDGVVIDYEYFGTMGTASVPHDLGRTTTHEIGHWLDLYHIWGDDGSACTGSDLIMDTPNQADENYGCPQSPLSCNNLSFGGDMYVNYMDYSDDNCLNMFTYWQYRRMEATLNTSRMSLLSSEGCAFSPPSADFTADKTTGATALIVNFSDLSTNSPTSWSWKFPGSTTTSSSLQNPQNITYNSPGSYDVTLISSNNWGKDTISKLNYILVDNTTGIQDKALFSNVNIYPNPATTSLYIELAHSNSLKLHISLCNIFGQVVYSHSMQSTDGKLIKQINVDDLAKGLYLLKLTTFDDSITQKIVLN